MRPKRRAARSRHQRADERREVGADEVGRVAEGEGDESDRVLQCSLRERRTQRRRQRRRPFLVGVRQPAGEGGDLTDGGGGEAVGLGVGGGAKEAEEAREHLGHERRRQRRRGRPAAEDDAPQQLQRRVERVDHVVLLLVVIVAVATAALRRRRRRGGLRGVGRVLKVESANQRGEEAGSERRQRGGRGGERIEDVNHRVCDERLAPPRRPQLEQRRRQPRLARGGRRRRGAQQRGERL